jgi:AcrR family transcriptional regulator
MRLQTPHLDSAIRARPDPEMAGPAVFPMRADEGINVASKASERRSSYSSPAIVARRKRILDIARALIAEKGYAQFNLGEVGTRAGVAKQTVYNIFGTRERIIATAISDYFEERESLIRYTSQPGTMERMIERLVVATRASESMPNYLGAVMAIYFSVDTDPDIWAAMHEVATYPHKAWIESLAAQGALQPWVEPAALIDDLAAHTSLALLDWCRGRLDTEQSIRQKVIGALTLAAGSTTGAASAEISAKLADIAANGLPDYSETLKAFARTEPDRPSIK